MIFLQTIGLILLLCVFALLYSTAYKMLKEYREIYSNSSSDNDLDLTKKQ
jgi:hypothetical protein